ncbi:MAG: hypothetical protein ABJA78_00405 [Ferruginibacter sp.]
MNNQLKRLQIIFKALLTGQILFFAVAIFIKYKKLMPDSDEQLNKILQIAILVISFVCVASGIKIFNKKIQQLKDSNLPVGEKFKEYQSAVIVKWAMTEGACIIAIAGYLLTGNYAFLALAVVLLFIFSGYNPVKSRIVQQLELNDEEAATL